jgi:hypothetical protein
MYSSKNYQVMRGLAAIVIAAMMFSPSAMAQLWVDFNSTSQDGGPHPQAGYEAYDAGHEVAADFVTMTY